MAIQSLVTIKNWFRTRLKPTQAQYWDTWDSFWHKNDMIPTSKITNLESILTSKASNESVASKIGRSDLMDTDDISWTIAGSKASAHTIGFTGTFSDPDGNIMNVVNGLIKSVEAPAIEGLCLTWDDIVNVPVADASNVADWNTFFDLPTNGTAFTSVVVAGNEVTLIGGSDITLKDYLFADNINLIEFDDSLGCVINVGYRVFASSDGDEGPGCPILTTVNTPACLELGINCFGMAVSLITTNFSSVTRIKQSCFAVCQAIQHLSFPSLLYAEDYCFQNLNSIESISMPACLELGSTVGNDLVFDIINNQIINLTVPAALMTCNAGSPDGDIVLLQANNTVTVITV